MNTLENLSNEYMYYNISIILSTYVINENTEKYPLRITEWEYVSFFSVVHLIIFYSKCIALTRICIIILMKIFATSSNI